MATITAASASRSGSVRDGLTSPIEMNESKQNSAFWPLAIVIFFACIVNFPCLLWGLQFGRDHNLHIAYLHFFDAQLQAGELYPRWISGLNFGAGSPIFFVQYPLPYYVAAGLGHLFHLPATPVGEAHALGLFVFFTGIVSGVCAWLWCRVLTNPVVAIFASAAYLTMPYVYGCDVYYRAAVGEYSALAWAPLALLFSHQIGTRWVRAIAGMASAFGIVILSNLFTAILFAPFLVIYAICRVDRSKRIQSILLAASALILGVGLSGVYFLPMNAHRGFFSLANLVRLGPQIFSYSNHLFPFGETLFPRAQISLRIVDLMSAGLGLAIAAILLIRLQLQKSKSLAYAAIICVLLTCAAPFLHLIGFVPHPEDANVRVIDDRGRIFLVTFLTLEVAVLAYANLRDYAGAIPKFLVAASLACYFLSTRWSEWLWRHASFLWNIQFPWRLSGLLSVFLLGLVALAVRDIWDFERRRRIVLLFCTALWFVIGVGSYLALDIRGGLARPFFTEIRAKIETPYPTYASISKLPTPEELGTNDGLINRVLFLAGDGTATLDTIAPRHLRLKADCIHACKILLKLAYYPAWQAHEASNAVPLEASTRSGLTELSLSPGSHEVDLVLPVARSEIWGVGLSLFSLAIVALLFLEGRERG
jgi:hypothetical protein